MIPSAGPAGTSAKRWRRLTRARLAEIERLAGPGGSAREPGFWDARARSRATRQVAPASRDPLLSRVRKVSRAGDTLIDVGAGPGRLALALAPRVGCLVAVDLSPAMLSLLVNRARRGGIRNITTFAGRWEDVEVPRADVVVCANVLPLIEDAARFLAKMDAACERHAFVGMSAMAGEALLDPFWRHFHGSPRRPGPTYLDALAVLTELGIRADVEVVELRVRSEFPNVAAAARSYRENLLLPDTAEVRRELRHLLSGWLVPSGGKLRPPLRTAPAAIIHWRPGAAVRSTSGRVRIGAE